MNVSLSKSFHLYEGNYSECPQRSQRLVQDTKLWSTGVNEEKLNMIFKYEFLPSHSASVWACVSAQYGWFALFSPSAWQADEVVNEKFSHLINNYQGQGQSDRQVRWFITGGRRCSMKDGKWGKVRARNRKEHWKSNNASESKDERCGALGSVEWQDWVRCVLSLMLHHFRQVWHSHGAITSPWIKYAQHVQLAQLINPEAVQVFPLRISDVELYKNLDLNDP